MLVEVRLPPVAASMESGVLSKWLKVIGESVVKGEPLFEVETEKVTTEVESPASGIVVSIDVFEGDQIDVGTVLATIRPVGSAEDHR